MLTRIHHVGLVVRRLDDGLAFWRDTLGLPVAKQAVVKDQGVRAALLPLGRSEIELLEPIDPAGGVAKFLERRGEGLHHVCFQTPTVGAELDAARSHGLPLLDEAPRAGLAGMIGFLHPRGTCGVLVEFATPPPGEHPPASPDTGAFAGLALAEVTARTRDAAGAAGLFAKTLGLAPESADAEAGVSAAAVGVGGVRLRFVSPDGDAALHAALERNGEGLAALVLEVADLAGARAALGPVAPAHEASMCRIGAEHARGVPLTFRSRRPAS